MALCLVYIVVAALCSSSPSWAQSGSGSGSGCSSVPTPNPKLVAQQRLESLLGSILVQLSPLRSPGPDWNTTVNVTEGSGSGDNNVNETETYRMYEALLESNKADTHVSQDYCRDGEFFAQPVTTFNVVMSIKDDANRRRRSLAHPETKSLLVEYTAQLNFHLNDSLQDISRADLLVYQLPTRTGPSIVVRGKKQYVEISTVMDDQRYTIEGKYIDTFADGFVVFQITKAVDLWIDHNVNGSVVLDMAIFCYSSPNCSDVDDQGKQPAVVKFLTTSNDLDKTPRVIVNSYSQVDGGNVHVAKRSSHDDEESRFCTSDEELCCLQPLTINFKDDLQMPEVLFPLTFDANYCQGLCPTVGDSTVLTTQRYTFLSELGNNHPAASIEPCCAGEEYKNLDVIMSVYNREVSRFETQIIKLHQVKVVGCRCA